MGAWTHDRYAEQCMHMHMQSDSCQLALFLYSWFKTSGFALPVAA